MLPPERGHLLLDSGSYHLQSSGDTEFFTLQAKNLKCVTVSFSPPTEFCVFLLKEALNNLSAYTHGLGALITWKDSGQYKKTLLETWRQES